MQCWLWWRCRAALTVQGHTPELHCFGCGHIELKAYCCRDKINHLVSVPFWWKYIHCLVSYYKWTCTSFTQVRLRIKASLLRRRNWQWTHGDPCLSFYLSMLTFARRYTLVNKQGLKAKQTFCSNSDPTFLHFVYFTGDSVFILAMLSHENGLKDNYAGSCFFWHPSNAYLVNCITCLLCSWTCMDLGFFPSLSQHIFQPAAKRYFYSSVYLTFLRSICKLSNFEKHFKMPD